MILNFKGQSKQYDIQISSFCENAFIIKDKIAQRDGVCLVDCNVKVLKFEDEEFSFDEIISHLKQQCDKEVIIIDEIELKNIAKKQEDCFITQDRNLLSISNENQVKEVKFYVLKDEKSKIFACELFGAFSYCNTKTQDITCDKSEKIYFLKDIEESDFELYFVKIELLNYDDYYDSISFDLNLFPSGASYKYGICDHSLHIVLSGKMKNEELFCFLKSFVYKNKAKFSPPMEKIFKLSFNKNCIFELKLNLV